MKSNTPVKSHKVQHKRAIKLNWMPTFSFKSVSYTHLDVYKRQALGFSEIGITDTHLQTAETEHQVWINKGFHGDMDYMAKHGTKRTRPAELVPNTTRIISARLDYLPPQSADSEAILQAPNQAFISRYALGRDYHKVMRKKLQKLCDTIQAALANDAADAFEYRVFTCLLYTSRCV